jgi:hypothetical protein
MARILLDAVEIEVTEDVEALMSKIVNSRDGLRRGSGAIIAPSGWVIVTASGTGEEIYVQVGRIGYVRED